VLATDASPAMLDLARTVVPDAEGVARIRLPDDAIPDADAIVGVGHPINYLPDAAAIERALVAFADALRPGGLLAFDICDLEWGTLRRGQANEGRVADDWVIVTRYELPTPDDYVRHITSFVPDVDGRWRRDDEEHHNVLIDTSTLPALFAQHGVDVEVRDSFGTEVLPAGLRAVVGRKRTP
jgi:SAM-dependent methyltransferase